MKKNTAVLITAVSLSLMACSGGVSDTRENSSGQPELLKAAQYTESGDFVMPEGWREWIHVATTATPNGLNNGQAAFPGMHNTYIDPAAYAEWKSTGTFPNGTVLVKELVDFLEPDHPDESSDQLAGRGFYPRQPIGVGIAVKDTERFAQEPGGWAYFSVPATGGVIAASGALQATESCNACHEASAADTDFVFLEYYPNLRNAAPE